MAQTSSPPSPVLDRKPDEKTPEQRAAEQREVERRAAEQRPTEQRAETRAVSEPAAEARPAAPRAAVTPPAAAVVTVQGGRELRSVEHVQGLVGDVEDDPEPSQSDLDEMVTLARGEPIED